MILNLTQHLATPEQITLGVVDVNNPIARKLLTSLLTFDNLPSSGECEQRAERLAEFASQFFGSPDLPVSPVMIGGAMWLMAPLARALREQGLQPVFAFSQREAVEQVQADGSVRKVAVFRHLGWVAAV